MGRIGFLIQGIKHIKEIGTITRSSKFVCKNMVSHIDFEKAKILVETGAGDGVITKHILAKMRPDAKLLSFEINPVFCNILRKIDDERLSVIEDSVDNIGQILKENGIDKADHIISAVPFVAFEKDEAKKLVQKCSDSMKDDGLFIQIHYSLLTKDLYESVFGNVKVNFVLLNVPPAFVLVSKKIS